MASLKSIHDIPAMNKKSVSIRNPEELLKKIKTMASEGHENLQVIADFDLTLTRHFKDDGSKVPTTFDMFNGCPAVPKSYIEKNKELAAYYKPIEEDGIMSLQEKEKHMTDWYTKVYDALKGFRYPRDEVDDEAKKLKEWFRHGVKDLFEWCDAKKVPVIIMSAGMGDCIDAVLRASNLLHDNVKIIARFCETDKDDIIVGMRGSVIHTMNKNWSLIKNTEYYDELKNRNNVLLMGDNSGDAEMTDGMENPNVIKIGFLSRNVEGNRQEYSKKYDIVLEHEHSVDVANAILQLVP